MDDRQSMEQMLSKMGGAHSSVQAGDIPMVGDRDLPKWLAKQAQERRAMTYAETEYLANIIRGMGVIDAVTIDTFARLENFAFDTRDQFTDPDRRAVFNGFLSRIIPESTDNMVAMQRTARELLSSIMSNPFLPPEQKQGFLQRLRGG